MPNLRDRIKQILGASTTDLVSQKVVTDELAKKQDASAGKGLSTNDYTNTEKYYVSLITGKQDALTPIDRFTPSLANAILTRLRLTDTLAYSDLYATVLNGLDFSGANFLSCNFVSANLAGSSFAGANLLQCKFTGANLVGTVLNGANVHHSCFAGAVGLGADIAAGLANVHLFTGLNVVWYDGYSYTYNAVVGLWEQGDWVGTDTIANLPGEGSSDTPGPTPGPSSNTPDSTE